MDVVVPIPNRFESILEWKGGGWAGLVFPVEEDLARFRMVRERSKIQNGGTLSFVLGSSGVGKTTAVYAATAHLPESFANVLSVPPYLSGEEVDEMTSSKKGQTNETTLTGFDYVQSPSAKQHKSINAAICEALKVDAEVEVARLEAVQGDGDVIVDAVLAPEEERLFLEFHHLSAVHCNAPKMSSYIMGKLRKYAILHNLAGR